MNWWFADWGAFVSMGGYGPQVWFCVLLLLLGVVWMLLPPLLRRKSAQHAALSRAEMPSAGAPSGPGRARRKKAADT